MSSTFTSNAWTDHVFKAIAEVRAESSARDGSLDKQQYLDLDKLISAGAALEALFTSGDSKSPNHTNGDRASCFCHLNCRFLPPRVLIQ